MWCDPSIIGLATSSARTETGRSTTSFTSSWVWALHENVGTLTLYTDRPAFEQDLGLQGHTGWISYRRLLVTARDRALLEDSCQCD